MNMRCSGYQRLVIVIGIALAIGVPAIVFAQGTPCAAGTHFEGPTGRCVSDAPTGGGAAVGGSTTELTNPLPVSDIPSILGNVLRALFAVLGSVALLMFIYGGFVWLTSGGEAEKIQKGKDTMVWAVLGIAIIFASFAIVTFVIDTLTKRA